MINPFRQCVKTFFKKNRKNFKNSYISVVFIKVVKIAI